VLRPSASFFCSSCRSRRRFRLGDRGSFSGKLLSPFGGKKKGRASKRKEEKSFTPPLLPLVTLWPPGGQKVTTSSSRSREGPPSAHDAERRPSCIRAIRGCSLTSSPQNGCGGNLRSLTPSMFDALGSSSPPDLPR
jgi:hypothetical protein